MNKLLTAITCILLTSCAAQQVPEIWSNKKIAATHYLPDFSYAGYQNGEKEIPKESQTTLLASDYGVTANDGLDDTVALKKAIKAAMAVTGSVTLQLPAGRLILSDIIYIERSNFILRGAGSDKNGTELYFPRPLMYAPDPEGLQELREYLVEFDKRQREKQNNIDLPFSQYAWSGGYIWTQVPGERVKSYLQKYEQPYDVKATVASGLRGTKTVTLIKNNTLKVGDVVELQLFNKTGKNSNLITELYKGTDVNVGSHHWMFPDLPIVRQQVEIVSIKGNKVTLSTPLTIDIEAAYKAQLVTWNHLSQVGIEHLSINFPDAPYVAHHVEQGYNGINLTRLYNSWVQDVVINNADSGILTEEIANVTIRDIKTTGTHKAHYTVAMAGVHNVLVERLEVHNLAIHPLSFNTFSTKNIYKDCTVFVEPVLDQHSGANHQNLFDNNKVHIDATGLTSYPLFAGGGAGYWKPSHGAFSTFWNTEVIITNNDLPEFNLNGMSDGPYANVIGVHGNKPFSITYGPEAYIEGTNTAIIKTPSLYEYQLQKRLSKK
jgi:hypothetical protein